MAFTDPRSAKVYAVKRAGLVHTLLICTGSACENILIMQALSS